MSEVKINNENHLFIFFLYTFIWSWLFWLPGVLNSQGVISIHEAIPFFCGIFASFGPSIIAIIIIFRYKKIEGVKNLLKRAWQWNFDKKWLIPTIFLGFITSSITLIIMIQIETFPAEYSMISPILQILMDFFMILFIGGPIAEEFGWRGYALDKIQKKYNALISSLILGFFWSLWHLPLSFISGTTQSNYPFYEFFLMNLILSVLYSWLYNNTKGSLSISILFHWMMNLSAATIHYWYTRIGRWIGFFTTIIIVVIIIIIWGPTKLSRSTKTP
ncbi:CPBP family glutamic-type intramembrane protease [Promethearchaeum syntrophicum]|uniref:CPBP family glutamic-type intramembrane protease n=1 Tax=Promethearchaeum syntrophicum TaxID=2594042 RepID=A0A5B9DC29_9ARCH|nr:type II CAAX endopeptidase family protein [Candidatus Prometheoarchaeum syntrophicum]QEE16724.1 CAAX amino terminal protease self- immunity [Candidatus Prometheoarchaeum syntrophicum]